MKNQLAPVLLISLLTVTSTNSAANPFSLTLVSSKDNTLASNVTDNNNGAGDSLYSGSTSFNGLRRALIAFDVSGIPAGSTITQVSLELMQTNGLARNGAQDFSLHRMTSDWGEGTSTGGGNGGTATAGASTWNENFFGSSSWSTAGGDFVVTPSVTQNFSTSDVVVASTNGLVADVQDWVDNGLNYGWALLGNESTTDTAWRFASNNSTFGTPPTLTVTYTRIPEPTSIGLVGIAVVAGAMGWRRLRK